MYKYPLYPHNVLLQFVFQIPLSFFSKFMEKRYGPRWGNIVVWASLILGQPLCIMMYYHDYVITHIGKDLIDRYGHVWTNAYQVLGIIL
jgi:diacylglycerol O-acyltransferase-1